VFAVEDDVATVLEADDAVVAVDFGYPVLHPTDDLEPPLVVVCERIKWLNSTRSNY
jgi:hypothetical protein